MAAEADISEQQPGIRASRLMSLDAFRGITIAGMILVNNPGSWRNIYPPLRHAKWHGWTPTDLVFPFFLFIVGVSMAFSFRRRLEQGHARTDLLAQVVRRAIILFMLGLIMYGFPDLRLIGPFVLMIIGLSVLYLDRPVLSLGKAGWARFRKCGAWLLITAAVAYFLLDYGHFEATRLRVPGVLQRIAVCYLAASLIVLTCGARGRVVSVAAILLGYWLVVRFVSPPEGFAATVTGAEGLLHDWIDVKLLGTHLYGERPDPEGILSTLPAVATLLLGVLTGDWLQSPRDKRETAVQLFFMANLALLLGFCMDYGFPINKKIWSSSYVVLTAGLALHFLAMCYWLIDVKGYRRWCWPFVVFGANAIVVYVASSLLARMMARWTITASDGGVVSAKSWIYEHLFSSWAGPCAASLAYALSYIALWLLLMLPLYLKRIVIKI